MLVSCIDTCSSQLGSIADPALLHDAAEVECGPRGVLQLLDYLTSSKSSEGRWILSDHKWVFKSPFKKMAVKGSSTGSCLGQAVEVIVRETAYLIETIE